MQKRLFLILQKEVLQENTNAKDKQRLIKDFTKKQDLDLQV